MCRLTVILIASTFMLSSAKVLAIDCLSYLAADAALAKANNDADAAYQQTVQAAEAAWQQAVQNREAAWEAAGKAASTVFAAADTAYQDALESANRELSKAKADADANRRLAVADAWLVLDNAVSKSMAEIIDPALVTAFSKAWSRYRQANNTVFGNPEGEPEYFSIVKEFFESRFKIENALADLPPEVRTRHNAIRLAAEIQHRQTMISIIQTQRESYSVASDRHQQVLDKIREIKDSGIANSNLITYQAHPVSYFGPYSRK